MALVQEDSSRKEEKIVGGGWLRMWYLPELAALQEGYAPAGVGVTWVCGIGLALLLSLSNGIAIRRRIDTLNRKRS